MRERQVMPSYAHCRPNCCSSELTVREAWERIRSSESRTWLVTDQQRLVGVVNLSTLAGKVAEGSDKQKLGELYG